MSGINQFNYKLHYILHSNTAKRTYLTMYLLTFFNCNLYIIMFLLLFSVFYLKLLCTYIFLQNRHVLYVSAQTGTTRQQLNFPCYTMSIKMM